MLMTLTTLRLPWSFTLLLGLVDLALVLGSLGTSTGDTGWTHVGGAVVFLLHRRGRLPVRRHHGLRDRRQGSTDGSPAPRGMRGPPTRRGIQHRVTEEVHQKRILRRIRPINQRAFRPV